MENSVIILGAGPAGLGAAWKLASRGAFKVTVLERSHTVGGNAGSFELEGLNVDYGSHRLHPACAPEILDDIKSMLGDDLLDRPRHGRIRLRGRWLHFPLKPTNLALKLPPSFMFGAMRDAVFKFAHRNGQDNFAAVLEHGLGRTICRDFYFPYAEKIWGLPATELDAEQARRRVSAGSFTKLAGKVLKAVPGLKKKGAGRFFYPRKGYGQISEAYYHAACKAGATVKLGVGVTGVEIDGGRAVAVFAKTEDGEQRLPAQLVLSTIPLTALARLARPGAPPEVLAAADALQYRAMILIYLVLDTDRFTEFDAHYFPESSIPITRMSEPKNYGLAELPGKTVLCAELPCSTADEVWSADNERLMEIVKDSLATADIPIQVPIRRVEARKLSHAYPVYTKNYGEHFEELDGWVSGVEGLLSLGRQGLFVHDNTHHTLAMAYSAADCLNSAGEIDDNRWAQYRSHFENHVVED